MRGHASHQEDWDLARAGRPLRRIMPLEQNGTVIRVTDARPGEAFIVHLTFSDGSEKSVDLRPFLKGPIFEPLRDPARFRELSVDPELGTIVWPNGADICADVLYHGRTPAAAEKTPK